MKNTPSSSPSPSPSPAAAVKAPGVKVKRTCSCEQKAAQERNFCIFILRGAIGQKTCLEPHCDPALLAAYITACEALITDLKGKHHAKT